MNRVVKHQSAQQGFTLVELMLAMAFIGILLLAIAMTIIQVGVLYNKGLTMKEVSQSSRSITNDVTRTAAEVLTLNLANDYQTSSAGGRLCFGSYSYIWNYAQVVDSDEAIPDPNIVTYEGEPERTVQLVKVPDPEKIYCSLDSNNVLVHGQIRGLDSAQAQELLPQGDHKLGVYEFVIPTEGAVTDTSIGQSLYSLQFTIGSGNLSAMTDDFTGCRGPNDPASDLTYCNVQQFAIVLRVGTEGI